MKKYILLLFIPLLFSCEKIFHEEDNEYLVIETYREKVEVINGMYASLVLLHSDSYLALLRRAEDINFYEIFTYDGSTQKRLPGRGTPTNITNAPGDIFQKLYTIIINANSLLKYTGEDNDPELNGEAYFLRAYCYFNLARFFGTPPLVTDTDVKYKIEKPSYREVYEFIEADLVQAIRLLPDTYTNARIPYETPHKGTAKALLAEVYLSMAGFPVNDHSKYAQAASLAGEVIENANYYGFALMPDFYDLWKLKNPFSTSILNTENIFGLFYSAGNYRVTLKVDNKKFIFPFSGSVTRLHLEVKPACKYYASFPNNYRKYTSMTTGAERTISVNPGDFNDKRTITIYKLFDSFNDPKFYINNVQSKKNAFVYYGIEITDNDIVDKSLYMLRYAQTLLTYAEAKGHIGEVDELALNAVNMIRRRSYKLDISSPSEYDLKNNLTKEQFTDSVIWERAWELFFEPNGRWFDIIRLDLKDKLPDYWYTWDNQEQVEDESLSADWYFYLIPQEDRWLNPDFEKEE